MTAEQSKLMAQAEEMQRKHAQAANLQSQYGAGSVGCASFQMPTAPPKPSGMRLLAANINDSLNTLEIRLQTVRGATFGSCIEPKSDCANASIGGLPNLDYSPSCAEGALMRIHGIVEELLDKL